MAELGLAGALAVYLEAQSLGVFTGAGKDLFVGEEPPTPDSAVTIYEDVGGRFQDQVSEEHLVTIRVRAASYETAKTRMRGIFLALHEQDGDLGGILARIVATAPPAPLGRDSSQSGGRWRWSTTFNVLAKLGFDEVTI